MASFCKRIFTRNASLASESTCSDVRVPQTALSKFATAKIMMGMFVTYMFTVVTTMFTRSRPQVLNSVRSTMGTTAMSSGTSTPVGPTNMSTKSTVAQPNNTKSDAIAAFVYTLSPFVRSATSKK